MNFQNSQFENQRLLVKPNRNMLKINEHQLGLKFRSKYDIYQYLTEVLHYYLPPKDFINKDFIRQILKEEKLVLKMDEVKFIKVPRYQELSLKNLIQQAQEDDTLRLYFPDFSVKGKPVPRDFFFNIVNTIYPEYVQELVNKSQNKRTQPELNEQKKDYILISDSWYDKLMAQPFISRKPGKTIQLLKKSCKIFKGRKQRVSPELPITLKRFKKFEANEQILKNKDINIQEEESEQFESYVSEENTQNIQKKNTFII